MMMRTRRHSSFVRLLVAGPGPLLPCALLLGLLTTAQTARAEETNTSSPHTSRESEPPPPAFTRTDESANTLLSSRLSQGGYGAPELKLTTLAGDAMMLAGAQGGWVLGHRLVIGGGGYSSITSVVSPASLQPSIGDANAHMSIGYGGFRVGAVAAPGKIVHMTFGVLIGGGGATSETRNGAFERDDRFFVVEPDLATEINLSHYVRLALGGTFRFVGGTDVSGFTASRLSGPSATAAIRFGEF